MNNIIKTFKIYLMDKSWFKLRKNINIIYDYVLYCIYAKTGYLSLEAKLTILNKWVIFDWPKLTQNFMKNSIETFNYIDSKCFGTFNAIDILLNNKRRVVEFLYFYI